MTNIPLKVDFNSIARRHPERSRFSGGARDLPQNSCGPIVTAAKPTTSCISGNSPLPTGDWTNQ